jgi:O-antigen ligase
MIKIPPLTHWPIYGVLLFLAASTVSTKAAGAFWLSLTVISLVYWLKKPPPGLLAQTHPAPDTINRIAKGWLIVCGLAFVLKSVPMVYWSGPWQERHAEFRLLIGAIGSYLLLRHQRLPKSWGLGVGHALAVACLLALALAAVWGSNAAPTNRIPWAAGVSVLTCLLLAWSFVVQHDPRSAGLWRLFSFLGVCSVLISAVRGSFLLLLVWPALWWALTLQAQTTSLKGQLVKAMLAGAIAMTTITLAPRAESPWARVQQVITELQLTNPSNSIDPNSSNGARMVLWKAGINAFQDHWLIGLGFTGGKQLIQQTAQNHQSEVVKVLGHFHNDYIHTAVEFGLFGLLSFLGYCFGMAWCAWRLWVAKHTAAASGMVAILAMHMSTAMSNMNFAHNYYPTVLSLAISLLLLSPRLQTTSSNH